VAAPLCLEFVNAVDATSAKLRAQLGKRSMPTDAELEANINEWIELINGTHMAALILVTDDDDNEAASLGGDQDLARFGRSLQSLEEVLVEEFAKIFVGTVLMERTKLAGYLIRCSHFLAADNTAVLESVSSSSEIALTRGVLLQFLAVCDDMSYFDTGDEADAMERSQYAPKLLKERVLDVLGVKLMEVALDLDDMTPDLLPAGCAVFANDIETLFGTSLVSPTVLRLLEITKVMAMPSVPLSQLGDALCGLADRPAPLLLEHFTVDDRLYEEATSMLHAKGCIWLELVDVLNVLNRRRDLLPYSP
jgi:hypothetical protein